MKLKDVKVGQIVVDKYGNEYIIKEITKDDRMPVYLECVKFVKKILVQKFGMIEFYKEGQSFFVYKSNKIARNDDNDIKCITVKSLKLKDESI